MRYRKLGRTDIEVSVICQGCWSLTPSDWTWGGNARADSIAAVRASLDAGVNFFDTAEGYGGGESERVLGEALGQRRKDVVIASKVSSNHLAPGDLKAACEGSLNRLGKDYIDLYQIHWPSRTAPLADTLGAMEDLKGAGKVRAVGVSNFGHGFFQELLAAGRAESNQLAYSLLWRVIEREVQPLCVDNEMSILCYSPLCASLLTGKFATADDVPETRARTRHFSSSRQHVRHGEDGFEAETFQAIGEIRRICNEAGLEMAAVALAWCLSRPGVAAVLSGARNADQAQRNAQAAELELSADVIAALDAATEAVRRCAGASGDMWAAESRMDRRDD
ncbi:MAG TPA: aldo/keto reductase [Phycisphaerae bacterium]|nr:aldo/keto reductase [Phycisphaerae bacterium]